MLVDVTGDAKVRDLDAESINRDSRLVLGNRSVGGGGVPLQQNIFRLDIAMDDAA